MDANAMLSDLRRYYVEWQAAEFGSTAEQSWAQHLAHAFAAMDAHLKAGGDLPADWDVSAETDESYPEFPND